MTTEKLLAFHGKQSVKNTYLKRVRAHAKADEIIAGQYWEKGKGCAVGCTIHGDSHAAYEDEIGIPRILARLEDRLFESIFKFNPVLAKAWPERFLAAAEPGSDLSLVWPKFALWLLADSDYGVIRFAKTYRTKKYIRKVSGLYCQWINGEKPSAGDWTAAAFAAAGDPAADTAIAVAAAATVCIAAISAAGSAAAGATDAAAAATFGPASDGDAAAADFYRRCGAWPRFYGYGVLHKSGQDHYVRMANKLIELMETA